MDLVRQVSPQACEKNVGRARVVNPQTYSNLQSVRACSQAHIKKTCTCVH